MNRAAAILNSDQTISKQVRSRFDSAKKRLLADEPIQYILGETVFYNLRIKVTPDVLIPRPETEELVHWIVEDIKEGTAQGDRILDLGTGSGCIAISLADALKTEVTGLDVSEEALKVAVANAWENKVSVNWMQLDILSEERLPGTYTIMVSNPPYVRFSERELMKPNVVDHEPHLSLFVENDDPLLFYKKIAALGQSHLIPGGLLYFEINEYLSEELTVLLQEFGYSDIVLRKDLFGKDRMIRCRYA